MLKPRFLASSSDRPASTTLRLSLSTTATTVSASPRRSDASTSAREMGRVSARLPDFTSSRTETSSQPRCSHAASIAGTCAFSPRPDTERGAAPDDLSLLRRDARAGEPGRPSRRRAGRATAKRTEIAAVPRARALRKVRADGRGDREDLAAIGGVVGGLRDVSQEVHDAVAAGSGEVHRDCLRRDAARAHARLLRSAHHNIPQGLRVRRPVS